MRVLHSSPVLRPARESRAWQSAASSGTRRCRRHQHRRVLDYSTARLCWSHRGETVARQSADSGGERRCQQHRHRRVLGMVSRFPRV